MKLRECLEEIQEKKYESVSLWAKNNFNGWYMVQATTPNGLQVHWLTKQIGYHKNVLPHI